VKLQRAAGSPSAGGTGSCALRAICRRWRALDSCAGCPRAPGGAAPRIEPAPGPARSTAVPAPTHLAAAPDGAVPTAGARLTWRVHHDLPCRIRFRLVAPVVRASAEAVEESALAVPGVRAAQFTPETGSLLVEHDGAEATRGGLLHALERLSPEEASARPGGSWNARATGSPAHAMRAVVVSLLTAALPPVPRAVFKLVRSVAAAVER
jgi:hypothetical protein